MAFKTYLIGLCNLTPVNIFYTTKDHSFSLIYIYILKKPFKNSPVLEFLCKKVAGRWLLLKTMNSSSYLRVLPIVATK